MVNAFRDQFNSIFTEDKYKEFINYLNSSYNFNIRFRVAETPVFLSSDFKKKLIQASDEIISFITTSDFKQKTNHAIPSHCYVPNENSHSHFLALDFAIVKDEQGNLQPQLIELQGFPSLFGFQDFLGNAFKRQYPLLEPLHNHFGLSSEEYKQVLKKFLLGNHYHENVVLL